MTYQSEGEEKQFYVRASPNSALKGREFSNLAIYDANFQRVPTQSKQIQSTQQQKADDSPKLAVDQNKVSDLEGKGSKVKQGQQPKPKKTVKQRR
ncbi:MAG: hypothetical protein ACXVMS_08355 [Flavisolibacter sp.]